MDKFEVAQILREIGMLVELTDINPKKGLAYRKAASTIESIPNLEKAVENETLITYPGIGKSISQMVATLVKMGTLPYYKQLKKSIPESLFELAHIPGLNLAKIRSLFESTHITNIDELENAIKEERLQKVKGFGPSFLKRLEEHIDHYRREGRSVLYPQAIAIANAVVEILGKHCYKIEVAGELRRKLETIAQIDFVAVTDNPQNLLTMFSKHGLVKKNLYSDQSMVQVMLNQGILASLHVVREDNFPFKLLQVTGNTVHLKSLNDEALQLNYSSLEDAINYKHLKNEKALYRSLELPFILPELREGYGEVEAARHGCLPTLIEERDIKGAFHCHTIDSDGSNTIEELVAAARQLDWEYIGISDHSQSSYQDNGMNEDRLFAQIENIKKINKKIDFNFKIFSGIECDILKDGRLDFPDDVLKNLDFVIVSIHRYFNLEEKEMTNRFIKAIENPYTTMIGHLTGRLLIHRKPYELN
ncbi:MAG: PHP domain-containing protein, partial [Parachlamydiaceae bacterium]|nr:PHP domain-containing protein [Parachlamydiaceae bacterium]